MTAIDPHWIAAAFGAVNSIRVVFYLPQIVAVARSNDGARDIALSTWAMWALTNGLGAAYGLVVAHDRLLALSFAMSLLACLLTIALTVVQRLRWARRSQALLATRVDASNATSSQAGSRVHRFSMRLSVARRRPATFV